MYEDARMLLESFWEGLLTRSEATLKLTELAREYGKTFDQLCDEVGLNPRNLEPK